MLETVKIPREIRLIIKKLKENGFQAYIVGGCVRDILRNKKPNDWDITTNAKPSEIQKIFPKSYLENDFGTVTVLTKSKDITLKEIEITPYRIESKYSDLRHPDEITWAETLEEDLKRRDFTINAMAMEIEGINYHLIDLFNGFEDLNKKIIRAVGNPEERFQEDALRLIRAIRFAVTLDEDIIWEIEENTAKAIKNNAKLLEYISKERIRDEFLKIIGSKNGARGVELLRRFGLLTFIIPELEEGFGLEQNKHHIYQVYQHALLSLNYACQKNFPIEVRIAALLHDVGKPRTKQGEGPNSTFYNHEIVGAKITKEILERLKFPKKDIEKVVKLVRYHLFYYNQEEVSDSSVRRLLRSVGSENFDDLLKVRQADRIGSGVPKAEPYRLRYLRYVAEKVLQDPISVKMLKVNGNDVMRILNIKPGPKIGQILDILLGEVLENPEKNEKSFLEKEIQKLGQLSEEEFSNLAKKAKEEREKIEQKRDEMTRKKYWLT
jgi:poly(A) polymerase/tRNA nucleotidyltransferase (CCA-adding enzyme)